MKKVIFLANSPVKMTLNNKNNFAPLGSDSSFFFILLSMYKGPH